MDASLAIREAGRFEEVQQRVRLRPHQREDQRPGEGQREGQRRRKVVRHGSAFVNYLGNEEKIGSRGGSIPQNKEL